MEKVKNLAEERESKMELMLQVAKRNNIAELEEKAVGLMLAVRRTSERLAKEIRKGQLTAINEEYRGWHGLYTYIESQAYPNIRGKCYLCHLNG